MKLKTYLAAGMLTLGAPMAAQAALKFDTQGLGVNLGGGGNIITVDAFDWVQNSFLAEGGVDAILAFANTAPGADCGAACDFKVYTHGVLGSATLDGTSVWTGKTSGDDLVEVTFTLAFTETVTAATPGSNAAFAVNTAAGVEFEIYWDETPDSDALTGSGYNDGSVILFGEEILDATGFFLNTGLTPEALDQTSDGNDYDGQSTLPGTGSNSTIDIGGLTQDTNFFKNALQDFGFDFSNVSLSLPYTNVNPSDCFNGNFNGALGASTVLGCNTAHVDGTFEQNEGGNPAGTIVPRTGTVNGTPLGGVYANAPCLGPNGNACPDFVAQTDTNSGIKVDVPAPGTLAITGLGLILLGARRRKA